MHNTECEFSRKQSLILFVSDELDSIKEDCMQYGFIELWKTYNRNKMRCSKKYLRKAITNTMIDGIRYWFDKQRRYIPADEQDLQFLIDKINQGHTISIDTLNNIC